MSGLALRSLGNRRFTVLLTLLSVALSVALLLGVERIRIETRSAFVRSVAGTDLIIGARAHPVQLLLYSVFRVGDATNNLDYASFKEIAARPDVAWAVPISLGDSHRGFRVLGTSTDYFEHVGFSDDRRLEFQAGRPFGDLYDAVLGADVARDLGYATASRIVLAHGTARVSTSLHDDQPFIVSGVLARTGTPADQSVYVSLEAIEAIHRNWRGGTRVARTPTAPLPAELVPTTITAAFIGLKSRSSAFGLQRQINEYRGEPLTAILPGVALSQLWSILGSVERALLATAACVVAAALMVLLTSVAATLNERRREMAILRAVGAAPRHIFALLLMEALALSVGGVLAGYALLEIALGVFAPLIESRYGLYLPGRLPTTDEVILLAGIAAGGLMVGLVPAFIAYRRSIADGMNVTL